MLSSPLQQKTLPCPVMRNEADTRAELVDPALQARGRHHALVKREQTAGAIDVIHGQPRQQLRSAGSTTPCASRSTATPSPSPSPLLKGKVQNKPPGHGLEQAGRGTARSPVADLWTGCSFKHHGFH